ncbi:type IV pilus modification PilV family protein [Caldanaerobacter sp.]|uniref:type IV pilus modification PilV family protein n=1 Tax=Caldanaerobacter sp. TaxID=2930036 RepID=UPI003C77273A
MLNSEKGMTLIEVLVSIAIFAVVAVPLLGIFSQSAITSADSRIKTKEVAIARTVAENIKAGNVKNEADLKRILEDYEKEGFLPYIEKIEKNGITQYKISVGKIGSDSLYSFYIVGPQTSITNYTPVVVPSTPGGGDNLFYKILNYVLNLITIILVAVWSVLFILFVIIPAFGWESIVKGPQFVTYVIEAINSGYRRLKDIATTAANRIGLAIPGWLRWW